MITPSEIVSKVKALGTTDPVCPTTAELVAEVNDPDVTLVTNKELPPFWKYWFAAIEVK